MGKPAKDVRIATQLIERANSQDDLHRDRSGSDALHYDTGELSLERERQQGIR